MTLEKIGNYKIISEIGSGGMSTVYLAYQESVGREVAIKVIHSNIADNATLVERFQREARFIALLEHPHIIPVYDFDGRNNPPYIVMRHLEGGTLADVLRRGEPIPLNKILDWMRQIISAVDYAHRQGVVHRDLKPSNFLIDPQNNVFISDFGIARIINSAMTPMATDITGTGYVIGTPDYMSPEQAQGLSGVDHHADIYSLGVILFELLTGRKPYHGDTPMIVIVQHINGAIPRPSELNPNLPPKFDEIIAKAMAKSPKDRFQSASEMGEMIEDIWRSLPNDGEATIVITPEASPAPTWEATIPDQSSPIIRLEQLKTGFEIGKYKLLQRLDFEDENLVFHAHDMDLDRDVAVKIIHLGTENELAAKRFKQEARILGSLSHPHIIQFYDYASLSGIRYLVMPLLRGGTLTQFLKRQLPTLDQSLKFIHDLANALDYMHERNIIHRDFKADHLMLNEKNDIFITDFGIAKNLEQSTALTITGQTLGTPAHMAPEQWAGLPVTPATDQYALGILTYQLLTGRMPFENKNPQTVMASHLYDTPPLLSNLRQGLNPQADQVLLTALAKKPHERYASVNEFATALTQAIRGQLVDTAIEKPAKKYVFISYSRANRHYARALAHDLRKRNFAVWIDEEISYGERWFRRIQQALEESYALIVVMTPEAEESEWVEKEIMLAQREHIPIFPLLLEGKVFGLLITSHYVDVQHGGLPEDDFCEKIRRAADDYGVPLG